MTDLGRAGRESIWLPAVKHRPRCIRSVCLDLGSNIFPFQPFPSVNKDMHISLYGKEIRAFWLVLTRSAFYHICVSKSEKVKINKFGPVWVSYQWR